MASFREQLRALQTHPGVRTVVAAGRHGLLIDHAAGEDAEAAGDGAASAEHLAALVPGLVAAADMLADADQGGAVRAIVVEAEHAVVVALPVTTEVVVLAAVDPGHAEAAGAIAQLRRERTALASSV